MPQIFEQSTRSHVSFRFSALLFEWYTLVPLKSLKYACNAFHATKISFANDMGRIFSRLGVDSREVMELFCEDTLLNISPKYLRPGFAFGGSCLPKDLRSLLHLARAESVDMPLLSGVLASNRLSIDEAIDRVVAGAGHRVAILGLSFKPDSDDLRESPYVDLAETLLGKGYEVRIYDPVLEPLIACWRQPAVRGVKTAASQAHPDQIVPKRRLQGPTLRLFRIRRLGLSRYCLHPHRCEFSTSMVAWGRTSRLWTAMRDSPGDSES